MNDTNNLTATPKMFTRFLANQAVKDMIKEARRVKYTVTKDDMTYTVKDGDQLVLKALRFNRSGWIVRFSVVYWNEPVIWKS